MYKKRCSYHLICKSLDEGLVLSGFFAPKKMNPVGRVFWLFPELNAAAFARRLGIPQPLFAAYVNGTKKPSAACRKKNRP